MRGLRAFLADRAAATAAEFAMVLPVALLFLLGLIDVGRFVWSFNQAEKATQIGARWAVATDLVPSDLITYSFAQSGAATQGTVVPKSAFPGVSCTGGGTLASPTVTCTCKGTCAFSTAGNAATFGALVNRMHQIYGGVVPSQVRLDYDWSGLGFSGDPNGPDVLPFVTVRLINRRFPLFFALGTSVPMPNASYTLTLEDGQGTTSN